MNLNEKTISKTAKFVKDKLAGESSGHDWWHAYRVWKNAQLIGKNENADMFVVELAALLHDIADFKFHDGDEGVGIEIVREHLTDQKVERSIIDEVCATIKAVSYKGANAKSAAETIESKIVQDADRLDAIGAMGIARNFMTGAKFNEVLYDPEIDVPSYSNELEYVRAKGKSGRTVINHFYEKSLLLKDLMNTESAKSIAEPRHEFMKQYLDEFFDEWEGKK